MMRPFFLALYNGSQVSIVTLLGYLCFYSHIGLKQGDPSSPILFMLFVNDMLQQINSNLDGIFTLDEIFLILFADDQVAFAKSPQSLQLILNDIEKYCTKLGIHINTSKTKAMFFEKGKCTYYDVFIYNTKLELVDNFKYLGITLFKNGNLYRSQKCIAQHASYALFYLFTVFSNIELPTSQNSDSCKNRTIMKLPCRQCFSLSDDQISNAICANRVQSPQNTYINYFQTLIAMLCTKNIYFASVL